MANFASEELHLAASGTNAAWITANANVFKCNLDGELKMVGKIPIGEPRTLPRALVEDHTGALWVGTRGAGLFRYDESGFEKIDNIYPYISSLVEDHHGDIWAGTAGGGLVRISRNGLQLEGLDQGFPPIQSICEDTDGVFWAATQNHQLVFQSDGKWIPAPTNFALPRSVTCVAAARNGGLWLGTPDAKFYYWHGDEIKGWSTKSARSITGLLPGSGGDLWTAEYSSLIQCLHDGQLRSLKLPSGRATALAEDAHGTIWVGTERGKLFRSNGDDFVDESSNLPFSGHQICCFCPTKDGSLWIGFGGGLARFKDGQFAQVQIDRGLPDDYISQIVADDDGWLWFAADHGIFKIRQQQLEQVIAGRADHMRPVVYGRNEGLVSLEGIFSTASPYILPNGFRSSDGRVWLLTRTGVLVADPKILHKSPAPPPVFVTRVAVDNRVVAGIGNVKSVANLKTLAAPLRLPPRHRKLEFEFTALNLSAPESIRFRYRLEGLDDDWVDADTREAGYSRLTAGNYKFQVQACNDDGPWSEATAPIGVVVAPFFWQTGWFEAGMTALLVLIVIAIVRYVSFRRLRLKLQLLEQQAALEKERTRIARDIHDDVGSSMTQITLLSGLASRDRSNPAKVDDHARQISFAARHVTDALDEIVWAVNPRNDTLPHLVGYIGEFASEFLRMADIRHRIDLPAHLPNKYVSTEARHNLFLVVKESLNNIARHAHATETSLQIVAGENSMRIIITDN
ncbi:MAG TPA: two-component regulator propeller domain-containing protein, partial [Desulfuromonadaceae bacterium]|nr:two-component regulator propeller domain-containing protein [Desulfuromonadaceae bacterium]